MCVLNGFSTTLASKTSFPFGVWFANATTLYVADEGNGTNTYDPVTRTYTAAATQTTAGLQKWVFNGTTWNQAYVLHGGIGPWRAVYGRRLSHRHQFRDRASVVACHRWPSQHHRPRERRWHRHDLGRHLDGERKRRPRRRSEQAGHDHR